mmetsp:Transcript_5261/g.6978  ORF Transcript_5261/g.6978 Transcript_5261/m.6978 type:complete len:106 (+) Transcript_5261:564-881(+)
MPYASTTQKPSLPILWTVYSQERAPLLFYADVYWIAQPETLRSIDSASVHRSLDAKLDFDKNSMEFESKSLRAALVGFLYQLPVFRHLHYLPLHPTVGIYVAGCN